MTEKKLEYNPCKVRKHCRHYKKGTHMCDYAPIAFYCPAVSMLTFYVNRLDILNEFIQELEHKEKYKGLTKRDNEKLTKFESEISTIKKRIENISLY